jgi:hypothetical protein
MDPAPESACSENLFSHEHPSGDPYSPLGAQLQLHNSQTGRFLRSPDAKTGFPLQVARRAEIMKGSVGRLGILNHGSE